MKEKIKQLVQQYDKGGFSYSELEWELLNLYAVSNSVCSCSQNIDMYSKTITLCNKCHKEVRVLRTN